MATIKEYLERDHQCCDNLFVQLEHCVTHGDWKGVRIAFREFNDGMERHLAMEETVLFPAFEVATGTASGPTHVMRMEHTQIRGLLVRMADSIDGRDTAGLFGHAETLNIMLQQHNMKEEGILYPMTDRVLSKDRHEIIDAMRRVRCAGEKCDETG